LHTTGDGFGSRFFSFVVGLIDYRSGFSCFFFLLIVYIFKVFLFSVFGRYIGWGGTLVHSKRSLVIAPVVAESGNNHWFFRIWGIVVTGFDDVAGMLIGA